MRSGSNNYRPGVLAVWLALAGAITVPVVVAGFSPYLAWRSPIYIAAGFAGIIKLGLLLVQPLLAARVLPGLTAISSRQGWRFRLWRLAHASLALVTILGTVVHALLIEGAMETVTKAALCGLVLFACVGALIRLQVRDVKPRG